MVGIFLVLHCLLVTLSAVQQLCFSFLSILPVFSWFYLTLFNTSGSFGHSKKCFQHCFLYYKLNIFLPNKLVFIHTMRKRCEENRGVRKTEAWRKQFPSQLLSEVKYSFYSIRSSFGNKLFCVQTSKKHSKQSKIDQNIFHLVYLRVNR